LTHPSTHVKRLEIRKLAFLRRLSSHLRGRFGQVWSYGM